MALCLLPSVAIGQPCPGDTNGDREVSISEILATVNASLTGCTGPVPTPTRAATPTRTPTAATACPFRFNQAVGSNRFCAYTGPVDTECGPFENPVVSGWTTLDTTVVFVMSDRTGTVAVYARRTSPTAATVQTIAVGPDFDVEYDATGTITLPSQSRVRAVFDSDRLVCGNLDHLGEFNNVLTDDASRIDAGMIQRQAPARDARSAVARELFDAMAHH